jgi:GT2 family glycosyltransferase
MMPILSFVLLNYNSGKYVENLIDSLAAQTNPDWDLIVVDNASSDDSLELIINRIKKNKIKNWKVLRLERNFHFAKGMNEGIKVAKGEVIVPLNTDVFLSAEYVETLSSAYKNNKKERIGVFVGNEYIWDWNANDLTDQLRSSGATFVRRIALSTWNPEYEPEWKLLGPSGAAPALTQKALEKIKLQNGDYYDSQFIAFGEDIDLYLRMHLNGFRPHYLSKLRFWHIGSASYGQSDISIFSKPAHFIGKILANKWRIWKRIPSPFEKKVIFPVILISHICLFSIVFIKKGLNGLILALGTYRRTIQNLKHELTLLYPVSPGEKGLYAGWIFSRSKWAKIFPIKKKTGG